MKKHDNLLILAYAYVLLPLIIFLLGWTKFFVIGVPVSVAIIICYINLINTTKGYSKPNYPGGIVKKILFMIIALAIISVWIYSSGVGGYSFQNIDHDWRNEIFKILVDYKWPATKDIIGGQRGLSYYIGFWMIPALIGKIYGISAGFFAQYIWAIIGIVLTYLFICRRIEKIAIWPLLIFILFSGLDIVGWVLSGNGVFSLGISIDGWKGGYQYSSVTTQLFWVFNQAIYAWVITMIVLEEQNRRMLLLFAAGLFSATLPMLGLFPIILTRVLINTKENKTRKNTSFFKELFESAITYENIVGIICFAIVMSLFFGNALEMISPRLIILLTGALFVFIVILLIGFALLRKIDIQSFFENKIKRSNRYKIICYIFSVAIIIAWALLVNTVSSIGNETVANNNFLTYLEFLVIEIGLYVLLCKDTIKQNIIYIVSVLVLLCCPVIVIGASTDFCMRASIPALLILYLAVLDTLHVENKTSVKIKLQTILLVVVICIGSVTALSEMYRAYQNRENKSVYYVGSNRIFERQNFSVDVANSPFYKYIAAGQNWQLKHYNTITYSDWSTFESEGYTFDGQYALSTEFDPHIFFYCPERTYQIELDIQWNSFLERIDEDGEYSNAQIFWTDDSGNFSEDNSKWIRLRYGRDSYVVNLDCPPKTLFRVDVGEGEDVQFDVYGITFKTVTEYTSNEKLICLIKMIITLAIVIATGYIFYLRDKEKR